MAGSHEPPSKAVGWETLRAPQSSDKLPGKLAATPRPTTQFETCSERRGSPLTPVAQNPEATES